MPEEDLVLKRSTPQPDKNRGRATHREGRARIRLKVVLDLAIWTGAVLVSFPLRTPGKWLELGSTVPLFAAAMLPVELALILGFSLHRQVWRRIAVEDLERIVAAVCFGTAIMFGAGWIWWRTGSGFPRTAPLIAGVLALVGLTGIRALTRLWAEQRRRQNASSPADDSRRVLLVGAGDAGTSMAREIRRHPESGMEAVGFLDDDPAKARLSIAGLRVLGDLHDLPRVAEDHSIDEVLITMPAATGRVTREVVELARLAGLECRILPGVTQVLSGEAELAGIRKVQVEDLLRREQVELSLPDESYIHGGTVLVTGAGGSIGSELVRQVAHLGPRHLVLFGHGENTLYDIQQELRHTSPTWTSRS